jgi:hypothetical protein
LRFAKFVGSGKANTPTQIKSHLAMKKLIITAAAICSFGLAHAQLSATATQTTNLSLADAIDITFTGTGTNSATVSLPFTTPDDYANGITSSAQTLKVRSTKDFNVEVKASSANFTYSGSASPTPTMPLSGIFTMKVSSNSTGGSIASPFSAFSSLSTTNQDLITGGTEGGNQQFAVQYKATPGFDYPGGTYTVAIIYTATQQ